MSYLDKEASLTPCSLCSHPQIVLHHLSDLFPQHGGAGVDNKHYVLGHHRQVFGSEIVDKVAV